VRSLIDNINENNITKVGVIKNFHQKGLNHITIKYTIFYNGLILRVVKDQLGLLFKS